MTEPDAKEREHPYAAILPFHAPELADDAGNPLPVRAPSAAELAQSKFAPGQQAEHPYAVEYKGEYETPWDGTAAAVRLHARALASIGIPVALTSFSHVVVNAEGGIDPVALVGVPNEVRAEVGDLCNTSATARVPIIRHAVIRSAEHAQNIILPRGAVPATESVTDQIALRRLVGTMTIVYSVWERSRIEGDLVRELNRAAQLWVPCRQNADMLINSGVLEDKVHVVPHPYDPDDDICKIRDTPYKTNPNTNGDWRLFYSIGRWEPRKGYAELIQAFLMAFKPSEHVKLTIKYTGGEWPGYPTPVQAVRLALSAQTNGWTSETASRKIELLTGRGARTGIIELHCRNNIYVASSHGEAWNLPAMEARLSGNALVYVPYGGVCDFAGALDIAVATEGLESVPESYHWGDAKWCKFAVADLAVALKHASRPREFTVDPKLDKFTLKNVGIEMMSLMLRVAKVAKPEAYDYYMEILRKKYPGTQTVKP